MIGNSEWLIFKEEKALSLILNKTLSKLIGSELDNHGKGNISFIHEVCDNLNNILNLFGKILQFVFFLNIG